VMNWRMSRWDGSMIGKKSLRVARACTSNGVKKLRKRAITTFPRKICRMTMKVNVVLSVVGDYHLQREIHSCKSIYWWWYNETSSVEKWIQSVISREERADIWL
jgi:hypothetical protein